MYQVNGQSVCRDIFTYLRTHKIPVRLNMFIQTSGISISSTCNYTDVQRFIFCSEIYINNISTNYPIWAGEWKVNAPCLWWRWKIRKIFSQKRWVEGYILAHRGREEDNMQLAVREVNCDGGIGFLWLIIEFLCVILQRYGFRYRLDGCNVFKDGYLPCN